jgi:hypothetical protein
MPSKNCLILRSGREARLETGTASQRLLFRHPGQFPDKL